MANKKFFKNAGRGVVSIPAMTTNDAGGFAYTQDAKAALAQIACTNCFNGTFYKKAVDTIEMARNAVAVLRHDPEFLAKVAVYSRTKSYMKDMPAFLVASLAWIDAETFRRVFPLVIEPGNGKMLRNFCQIARSGATGKVLNLTSGAVRRAIQQWFDHSHPVSIFNAKVGNEFALTDILTVARPKPNTDEKAALFAYLLDAEFDKESRTFRTYKFVGAKAARLTYLKNKIRQEEAGAEAASQLGLDEFHPEDLKKEYKALRQDTSDRVLAYEHSFEALPDVVRQYEAFKTDKSVGVPRVDFRLLDSLGLTQQDWTEIARRAPYTMTRMNLNTFARHGVFNDAEVTRIVAERLQSPVEIAKAKVFPYQMMMAWKATANLAIPVPVRDALQKGMEIATANIPEIEGELHIIVDVSGSMRHPVTGDQENGRLSYNAHTGSNTDVMCQDVAALFAASIMRKNPQAQVHVFSNVMHPVDLNARDSIATNADKLTKVRGGGTNCALPLAHLNARNAGGSVIFISDYESWIDSASRTASNPLTGQQREWGNFVARNPDAKLVCMDLTPRGNSQVQEHPNILQVGGFSDQVFDVVSSFVRYGHNKNHWVSVIESIELARPQEVVVDEVE